MTWDNPFADHGTQVLGDRFIGRKEEIATISGRVFGARGYGAIAVTGMPRIGKTSLVLEAVSRASAVFRERRIIVVRLEVGTYDCVERLLQEMAIETVGELTQRGWSTPLIQSRERQLRGEEKPSFDAVRGVFRAIRQAELRPVCILDEFDAGRRLFEGRPWAFHWLRELASNAEYKIGLILVAKRRLQDVAALAGHESNYWSNVMATLTLRPFSAPDFETYVSALSRMNVKMEASVWEEVAKLCGRHPYLLDVLAYCAWEATAASRALDVDWLRSAMRPTVAEYFEQVVTVLRDGPMLGKAVQILVGPARDAGQGDIDALVDYGVLEADDAEVRAFCAEFGGYLYAIARDVDIWPLWRNTERALRDALRDRLQEQFGRDWVGGLGSAQPRLKPLLASLEEKMNKERTKFGVRAHDSPLAYSYPLDIFQIMATDWSNLGEPLLGADKNGWSTKFALLAKVRTPLAHNREEAVTDGERVQAEGICREILHRLPACGL